MTANLLILLMLLFLSAFFSAAEVAFLKLSHAKVETMVKRGLPQAALVQRLKDRSRRLLVTILIGNNIVNIAAASLATVVVIDLFSSAAVGISTGAMTLLILTFGEIIPKAYASNHYKQLALFAALPLQICQWSLYPVVIILEWLTNLTAGRPKQEKISEEELLALAKVSSEQGNIEVEEGEILKRLFAMNDITAGDIMTPRVNVTFLKQQDTIASAAEKVEAHPYTRYPVMDASPDQVTGFVHSRDILLTYRKNEEANTIETILRPLVTVPKQMPIDDVMREFQKHQTHLAVVVDEFGGTEGIVTLEDVIEELVGEIIDEYDVSNHLIHRVDKDTIHVSGNTTLREINHFFNTVIPGNELDTIAEVMLDQIQKIPKTQQSIRLGHTTCTVLEVKKRRIQRVEIRKE